MGCGTFFGLSYLFTKTATQTAGAFALLGWRFVVAALIMSVFVCSVLSYELYSVFVEKAEGYATGEITYIMLVCGAVVFAVIAVCEALLGETVRELC